VPDDERLKVGLLLLGARLRQLRHEAGHDLMQLAELSGLSVQYLSNLEHGRRQPTLAGLVGLADALGTTAAALLADVYPFGVSDEPEVVPTPQDGRARRPPSDAERPG